MFQPGFILKNSARRRWDTNHHCFDAKWYWV